MGKRKITPERAEFRKQLGTLMAGAGIQSMEDIQELFREMIGGFVDQGLEGELVVPPLQKYRIERAKPDSGIGRRKAPVDRGWVGIVTVVPS